LGRADVAADVAVAPGSSRSRSLATCAVVGIDPEPAMLTLAAQAATGQKVANITGVLSGDSALPVLVGLLGERTLAAITIASSIHLMPHQPGTTRDICAAANRKGPRGVVGRLGEPSGSRRCQ
jgi:ubiquinone/menaquinone biosynthesis C-methylase UbiE